jgi:hypothetical protein
MLSPMNASNSATENAARAALVSGRAPGFIGKGESAVAPSGLATSKRRFRGQPRRGPFLRGSQ